MKIYQVSSYHTNYTNKRKVFQKEQSGITFTGSGKKLLSAFLLGTAAISAGVPGIALIAAVTTVTELIDKKNNNKKSK